MYQNILVAIDGSAAAQRGVDEAVMLARSGGARLHLVHVIDDYLPLAMGEALIDPLPLQMAIKQSGQALLDRTLAQVRAQGVTVDGILLETLSERVPHLLAAEANRCGADLIVMGSHGRRGLDHMLLGSVAEGMLRVTPVPLLLVRATEE